MQTTSGRVEDEVWSWLLTTGFGRGPPFCDTATQESALNMGGEYEKGGRWESASSEEPSCRRLSPNY